MPDVKISALPASTTPLAGTEVLPIVQSSTTRQVSVANLTAGRAVSAASLALTTTPLPITSGGTGTATAFTAGSIIFAGASGVYTQDNANLFWDDAANELGIGTTNPIEKLGVNGSVRVTADNQGMYFNSSTDAILGNGTNHTMSLYTNNVERITITSAGVLDIGTGGGAVGQIQFPATAVPSANANTLDDYEEGTWTVQLQDASNNNATMEAGFTTATYVKIGRQVTVNGTIYTSSVAALSGGIKVSGLPFAVGTGNQFRGSGSTTSEQLLNITSGQKLSVAIYPAVSTFEIYISNSATGGAQMTATEWSNDGFAQFNLTYFTN